MRSHESAPHEVPIWLSSCCLQLSCLLWQRLLTSIRKQSQMTTFGLLLCIHLELRIMRNLQLSSARVGYSVCLLRARTH